MNPYISAPKNLLYFSLFSSPFIDSSHYELIYFLKPDKQFHHCNCQKNPNNNRYLIPDLYHPNLVSRKYKAHTNACCSEQNIKKEKNYPSITFVFFQLQHLPTCTDYFRKFQCLTNNTFQDITFRFSCRTILRYNLDFITHNISTFQMIQIQSLTGITVNQ